MANANYFIPSGMEPIMVDKLVRERVVEDWEDRILGGYLKTIQEHLLNNKNCNPSNLLKLYLQIWYREETPTNYSKEKQELIELGLITEQANHLMVSNRLYQSIFDENWVKRQLLTFERNSATKDNRNRGNIARKLQRTKAIPVKNEPLTHIAALISLVGLLVITPTIVILNNSQYKTFQNSNLLETQTLSIENFCVEEIPIEEDSQQVWLMILQEEQQRLLDQFPDNCQHNLDRLMILNALTLSKNNRVIEGIEYLCQISTNSKSFNQAQFWLERWYNSLDWGEQTRIYLNSIADCPSAESLSIES